MEIRGRYRVILHIVILELAGQGEIIRDNIPGNHQDFHSCKQFVEWPALLSMNV